MNMFLQPGVALMSRLKYPYKFLLIFCLGVSLFAVLLVMLHRETNRSIAFTEKEVLGTTYVEPLKRLLANLQRHRGLTQGLLRGESSFRSKLPRIEANISELLRQPTAGAASWC